MTIQFKYYKATGEKAEAVKTKIIEAHHNTVHARRELVEKYHCDGLSIQGSHVIRLIYKNPPENMPFLIETGAVDIGTAYKPNRRFKAGIELARQFDKAAAFYFSRYACLEFGVGMSIIGYSPQSTTRTSLYSSVAGIVNKQLVFSIPYDAKTPLPPIPAELTEISEKEFRGENQ